MEVERESERRMTDTHDSFLLQGFKDTFQKLDFSVEEFYEVLKSPEPPFTLLAVSDLLEKEVLDKYEAAGGEVVF
jgi:hypothetical protein